jgi:hypothetical protein
LVERLPRGEDGSDDEDEGPEVDWERVILGFLDDHKDAIGAMLRDWGKGGQRRGRMLLAVMGFLGFVVLFTGLLTAYGFLSAEAFTFLVGSVLMYLFNVIGPRLSVG